MKRHVMLALTLLAVGCGDGTAANSPPDGGNTSDGGGTTDGGTTFTVTATAEPGGSIDPGSQEIAEGQTAEFAVTAAAGHTIDSVSGCGGSLAGSRYTTGPISGDCTVTATFAPLQYTVTGTAQAGGSIDPATATVDHGDPAVFTLTPARGFVIDQVSGCGGSLQGETYTTGAITADCTVEASFTQVAFAPPNLSATAGDSQIEYSWDDASNAESYNLYWATEAGVTPDNYATLQDGTAVTGVTRPHLLDALVNDTPYYAVVTSVVTGVESPPSNEVEATPVGLPVELSVELTASDGVASDSLGEAVAISGNIVVLGAKRVDYHNGNSGAAYVFELDGVSGTLTEVARLVPVAAEHGSGDWFGHAVSIDGDVIAVGAIQDRPNGRGLAYVYEMPVGGWSGTLTESAILMPSDRGNQDNVGSSIAIDGTTVVVGARGEDTAGAQAGALYVFEQPTTGWSGTLGEDAKLIPSFSPGNNGYLGGSVAIEAGVIVSGLYLGSVDGQDDAGEGLVFVAPAGGWAGTLTETARLQQSVNDSTDRVGRSVAISNGVIALGTPRWEAPGPNSNHGCVLVFPEPTGGWTGIVNESARLHASLPGSQEELGTALTMRDDVIIAGSLAGDRIHVFLRPSTGWSGDLTEDQLIDESFGYDADFGTSLALDGSTLVAGAPLHDEVANEAGKAFVYTVAAP